MENIWPAVMNLIAVLVPSSLISGSSGTWTCKQDDSRKPLPFQSLLRLRP